MLEMVHESTNPLAGRKIQLAGKTGYQVAVQDKACWELLPS
jgi:hypothetical protein